MPELHSSTTSQERAITAELPTERAAHAADSGVVDDDDYMRTEFLQRIAHDLRGHAGVIHGALQELEASFADPGQHATFFGMAKRGVKRVLRMAERLQQTGQLARGAPTLASSDCDIRALVQQAAEEADAIEGRKKIRIELDLPGAAVACVADAHWLSSAFFELASNAIRHAQGRVAIVVTSDDPAQVTVTFSDDGKSTGDFGPSRFRAPESRRGLGLGLAIVHDVIAAHGGTFSLSYGKRDAVEGTQVALTLPRR